MSEYADAKNYFQRLVNFSSASVYKDMLHHAITAFDRAEAAEAEVERLKGVLEFVDLNISKDNDAAKTAIRSALEAKP